MSVASDMCADHNCGLCKNERDNRWWQVYVAAIAAPEPTGVERGTTEICRLAAVTADLAIAEARKRGRL